MHAANGLHATIPAPDQTVFAGADRVVLICVWLLILFTITPQEREEFNTVGSLDLLARAKLMVRLGVLAALGLLLLAQSGRRWRAGIVWLLAPIALYLAWAFVSTAWSPLKAISLGQAISLLVLCVLAWAVATSNRGEATSRQLLAHTTLGLTVFSFCMLAAYLGMGNGGDRFAFGLAHPTTVAGTASLGMVLLVASAMIWQWRWARLLLAPGVIVHGSILLLAHSRMGLGVTVFVLGLLFAALADRRLLAAAALAGSVVLLAAATIDPSWQWLLSGLQTTGAFVSRDQSLEQITEFSGRNELWSVIWQSYLHSPWIGHGYFVTSQEGILDIWGRATNFNAHNMPFQALAGTGLIGAALFLWALGRPLNFALRQIGEPSDTSRRAGLFALISVWLWTWGMADAAILGPVVPPSIAFFVVFGLLAGAAATVRLPQEARSQQGAGSDPAPSIPSPGGVS